MYGSQASRVGECFFVFVFFLLSILLSSFGDETPFTAIRIDPPEIVDTCNVRSTRYSCYTSIAIAKIRSYI